MNIAEADIAKIVGNKMAEIMTNYEHVPDTAVQLVGEVPWMRRSDFVKLFSYIELHAKELYEVYLKQTNGIGNIEWNEDMRNGFSLASYLFAGAVDHLTIKEMYKQGVLSARAKIKKYFQERKEAIQSEYIREIVECATGAEGPER